MADIARRRADQPADRVPLHILGHVEAQHLDAEGRGQLFGHFGLAHARRAAEQEGPDRLGRITQAGAGQLHGRRHLFDRRRLAEDDAVQVVLEQAQALGIGLGHRLGRDTGHAGDDDLDLLLADDLLPLGFGQQHLAGTRLVDDVDRLVRQFAVGHVARRQLDRRAQGPVRVADLVVAFVGSLEPFQDLDRVLDGRLIDVDLLEATGQGPVLFEMLAVFLVGGRAHAAQAA